MRVVRYWLPVIGYAALIWCFSAMPEPPVDLGEIPGFDKVIHALEYGVLGWLLALAVRRTGVRDLRQHAWLVALMLALAYGITDEIHQTWVPDREAALSDLLADGVGGVLGGILSLQYLKAVALAKARRLSLGEEVPSRGHRRTKPSGEATPSALLRCCEAPKEQSRAPKERRRAPARRAWS